MLHLILFSIAAPLRTLRAPSAHSYLLRGPAQLCALPPLGVVGRGRGGAVRETVKERVTVPD